ncbi:MAG: acyltransferase [Planctomycetota bacterium]
MDKQQPPLIISHGSLRGIAALIVVGYHLQFFGDNKIWLEDITCIWSRGYVWVDFFFILSGFILTYVYGDRDVHRTPLKIRDFYVARLARVYPLHLFALCVVVCYRVFTQFYARITHSPNAIYTVPWVRLPDHLLLLQSWGIFGKPVWNIPAWSISTEMFAYLLFPLILAFSISYKKLAIAAAFTVACAFYGFVGMSSGSLDIIDGWALARGLAGFLVGMSLCLTRSVWLRIPEKTITAIQVSSVLAIVALIELLPNDTFLIMPFVILIGATHDDRGVVADGLSWAPLRKLGDWSYSIYILHVPVLLGLSFFYPRILKFLSIEPNGLTRFIVILLLFGLSIMSASLTFAFIEKPARKWVYGKFRGSAPASPVV